MNVLLAAIAIIGVSASGPLMAYAAASATAIGMWRNAIGALVVAPFSYRAARRELPTLDRRGWTLLVFAGVMLAVHFAAWIGSLQLTSVAAATAMVSMQIVFVVLIDRMGGSTIPKQVLVGMALAVGGVLVVTGVDFALSSRALLGDLLALVGGAAAALYLVSGSRLRTTLSTGSYTTVCYAVCAVILLVATIATGGELTDYEASTWWAILGVTVCAQLLGHSVFNHLLAVMSPTVISLALLLEVPGAAILAGVFLDQTPALGVYVGLGVILAGLAVVVLRRPPELAPVE